MSIFDHLSSLFSDVSMKATVIWQNGTSYYYKLVDEINLAVVQFNPVIFLFSASTNNAERTGFFLLKVATKLEKDLLLTLLVKHIFKPLVYHHTRVPKSITDCVAILGPRLCEQHVSSPFIRRESGLQLPF